MSDDEDLFDRVTSAAVDDDLTPTLIRSNSPIISSGVSSHGSNPQVIPAVREELSARSSKSSLKCPYAGCKKKPYKTQAGYDKHIFVHQVEELNPRKPSLESLEGVVGGLVCKIFTEIKQEAYSSELKISIMDDFLKASSCSPAWPKFLNCVSGPIISALTARTKLFPTNRYEEFLSKLNHLMNSVSFTSDVNQCVAELLFDKSHIDAPIMKTILFRLITRLGEEIQIVIVKEMSVNLVQPEEFSSNLNETELKLFSDKISTVLRSYFCKAVSLGTEVMRARCDCIRHRFIVNNGDESVSGSDIANKSSWLEEKLKPSEVVINFCLDVENIMKSRIARSENVLGDAVVKSLLEAESSQLLNKWYYLTTGFLSEIDAVVFMRDFASIIIEISLQQEQARLKRAEGDKRRQQKFSTRDNLKKN